MLKGDFIALNSYIVWLTPVFLGLQESIEDIIKSHANKRRVNECLKENTGTEERGIVPELPPCSIKVNNLTFSYEGAKKQLSPIYHVIITMS